MGNRLTLILGGARSGKSALAERLALELGGERVLYVATAEAGDEEMAERIRRHRAARPPGWTTLEAPRALGERIRGATDGTHAVVLVDCVTLLVSNLVCAVPEGADAAERLVAEEVAALLAAQSESASSWFLVSNEVGLGVVPPNRLGRTYRDALGRANQQLAAAADEVLLLVAGLPLRLK